MVTSVKLVTNDVINDYDGQFKKNHKDPLIGSIILRQKSSLSTVNLAKSQLRLGLLTKNAIKWKNTLLHSY